MEIRYLRNGDWVTVDTPGTEPYKEIGKCLLDADIPGELKATHPLYGSAVYDIKQRGKYWNKEGEKVPSMCVTEIGRFCPQPPQETPELKYLTCISSPNNGQGRGNYKFYLMEKPVNGEFFCEYGRIGSSRGEAFGHRRIQQPYEEHLFWVKYYEKLSKGYIDQTELFTAKPVAKETKTMGGLFAQLSSYSKNATDYAISQMVTVKMVSEAKKCLYQMRRRKTVKGFNSQLMKLLVVCPRKAGVIDYLLAKTPDDFPEIIQREESLVAAMEGTTYSDWGDVKVFKARPDQEAIVMKHLGDSLKGKVRNIYRVINPRTEKAYRAANKGVKKRLFWHGSKNENWLSIIQNGLLCNPDAKITGKMLGNGIYFAPSPSKSFGYTSAYGSYWARGKSNTAFMALFETAYGKPYMTNVTRHFTAEEVENLGCNCVYAKSSSTWLRADEVCFYKETDMTIMYLVEFDG